MTVTIAGLECELADRVLETTQTTGTGDYSLDGVSEDGYQSFVAGVGSGNRVPYVVELGTSWEVGVGTVTSGAPDTISRDSILASSNGGSAVNWAGGVKTIKLDAPAALLAQILDGTLAPYARTAVANTFSGDQTVSKADSPLTAAQWLVSLVTGLAGKFSGDTDDVVRVGSTSDHDVEIVRNDVAILDLDGSGVNVPSGTLRQDGNKVVAAPNIFESSEQTISLGSQTDVAHGLGGVPKQAWAVLRCKTADAGFSIGDEVQPFAYRDPGTDEEYGILVTADATNVSFTVGSTALRLYNKATGQNDVLSGANFRVVLRAWI